MQEESSVTKPPEKEQILKNAGYSYSFDRELYLNRSVKKAFSVEYLEHHSPDEIRKAMQEPPKAQWYFYFNGGPPYTRGRT